MPGLTVAQQYNYSIWSGPPCSQFEVHKGGLEHGSKRMRVTVVFALPYELAEERNADNHGILLIYLPDSAWRLGIAAGDSTIHDCRQRATAPLTCGV